MKQDSVKPMYFLRQLLIGVVVFCFMGITQAGQPLWTFSPIVAFPPTVSLSSSGSITIKYTITNRSHKLHTPQMEPIQGITSSGCTSALGYLDSCTLTLVVEGGLLVGNVIGGPTLCNQGDRNQCYRPSPSDQLQITMFSLPTAPTGVTAIGGNATATISWTAPSSDGGTPVTGYSVTSSPGGFTCTTTDSTSCTVISLTNGTAYTFTVTASTLVGTGPASSPSSPVTPAIFPAAAGPSHVMAVPGDSQVTVNWSTPTNTGTGTIAGYTVSYGPTSGITFTTPACTTAGTSCTITGLTNATAYTFSVKTLTTISGSYETGPETLSSSVTPTAELAVSPSTLALSSIGGVVSRTSTVINNSTSSVVINSISSPLPGLPTGALVDTSAPNDCTKVSSLAPGGSCTITITPGTTSSSGCISGTAPSPSVITITGNSGAVTANLDVVILGYGCQYQGGYLFAIDDTTPSTGSIGGKVVTASDQAPGFPGGVNWSINSDSLWGIDNTSTPLNPRPNESSAQPATLTLGQLNCDGVSDGACNTNNIFVFYGTGTTYAVGLCHQPLDDSGVVCSGGANCYTDWYLPAACENGPYGSTGFMTGMYPSFGGTCTQQLMNIQDQLVKTNILTNFTNLLYYWSSTESTNGTDTLAWNQQFDPGGAGSQSDPGKVSAPTSPGVRCARSLTF